MPIDRLRRTLNNLVTNVSEISGGLKFRRYDGSVVEFTPEAGEVSSGLEFYSDGDDEYLYYWADETMPVTIPEGTGLQPFRLHIDTDDSGAVTPDWVTVDTDPFSDMSFLFNESAIYQIYYFIDVSGTTGKDLDVHTGTMVMPPMFYIDKQVPFVFGDAEQVYYMNNETLFIPEGVTWGGPAVQGFNEYTINFLEFGLFKRSA